MIDTISKYKIDFTLLMIAVAVVYGRLVGYDFQINGDDNLYVLKNLTVQGFSWEHILSAFGPSSIGQYNPLALLSFMLDYQLWGLNPAGYHLTNILIHATNGILLYHLLMRIYGDRVLSLVAAALFLFHPVQVESVAWISERKGLLSLCFMLISWEAYCSYSRDDDKNSRLWYVASLCTFILSLLAKPMTVVFPVLLILFDLSFQTPNRRLRLLDKIPFFIAAIIFSAIVMYSEMPEHGGGRAVYHGGSGYATFLTMLTVFCRYLWMLFIPVNLTIEHTPTIHQTIDFNVIIAALILAVIVIIWLWLFKNNRKIWFWLSLFWLSLLPVSQIIPLTTLMYEHYLYLPITGFAVITASGVIYIRNKLTEQFMRPIYVVSIIFIILLAVASFQRVTVWQNYWTLWSDAAIKSPDSVKVWMVLGEAYQHDGKLEEAIKAYQQGLSINPASTDTLMRLGNLYSEAGNLEKGTSLFIRLLEINPTYVMAWVLLGNNYLQNSNYAEAERAYQKAYTLQPDAEPVIISLANLSVKQQKFDYARKLYGQVEAKAGNNPDIAYRMACLDALQGRTDDALMWVEKALGRGFEDYKSLQENRELVILQNDPRFIFLMTQYFPQ